MILYMFYLLGYKKNKMAAILDVKMAANMAANSTTIP